MRARILLVLSALGAVLLPLALSPAASVQTQATAPDLAVTNVRVEHLGFPPTRFLVYTTVCNFGTATVPGGVPVLRWTVQAQPGPLRIGSTGPVREFNVLLHEFPLGPGDCAVTGTFYGEAYTLGEYVFGSSVSVQGDTNPANNQKIVPAAWPPQLQGSGLGGTDLPIPRP